MNRYTGSCLCGACHYVITGKKPQAMYLCHCSRCRKETGSTHGATVFFDDAQLIWEKGQENITYFRLEHTRKERTFCTTCGSPVPWQDERGYVVLPAGTLDKECDLEPTAHIFIASRASWEDKLIHLPRFEALPT